MSISREHNNTEPDGQTAGVAAALVLFLCIGFVAFYAYQRSINPSADLKDILRVFDASDNEPVREAQVQYSFDYDSIEKPVFAICGDYIVKCSSGGVWFLDRKGGVVLMESILFNNPVIKTNGSYILAADIGAGEVCVFRGKSVRWREKLDASILNADISEDGYVTVVTESKRDNNEIRVFDPRGVELFRKIMASGFAVSAIISPSEEILAISGIAVGVAGAHSNYKFCDLQGNELANQVFDESGEMLPLFWYNNDDSLFAAGDRDIVSLDKYGEVIWKKRFRSIAGAAPAGNKRLAVVAEGDAGTQLTLYGHDGTELSSCVFEGKPRGLAAVRGMTAVYTYDAVYFYNDKCKNIAKYSADSQVKQVFFFDRRQAAVITEGVITIINIMGSNPGD